MNEHDATKRYIRLAERPGLMHPGYPICDACTVETDYEDGDWLCPSCGTCWPGDDMEAPPEKAQLYSEWSGEELTGPVCPNDEAWHIAGLTPKTRDQLIRDHFPQED